MSLLMSLHLPVPPHLQAKVDAATAARDAAAAAASLSKTGSALHAGSRSDGNGPGDEFRAEAEKLRVTLEAKRESALSHLKKLRVLIPKLKQMVVAANGAQKQTLLAKQAELAKRTEATEWTLKECVDDLESLANPASQREELVTIFSRHRSTATIDSDVETDAKGLDPYKKHNHEVALTTTEFNNGVAHIDRVTDEKHLSADGYRSRRSQDTEIRGANSSVKRSDERTIKVSALGKIDVEQKQVHEIELADGRKAGSTVQRVTEVDRRGVSQTKSVQQTNLDGSSTSHETKRSIERADGNLLVGSAHSETKKDAAGTARSRNSSLGGGLTTGDGALGAQASAQKGASVTSAKGTQAAVGLKLHGNVTFKIGEPKGDPKLYPVILTVSFGATAAVSTGVGKRPNSKVSGSIEVVASADRSMTVTHQLTEPQLAEYKKGLTDASKKGGRVDATQREFAVISAGVNENWDAARAIWNKTSPESAVSNAGDSSVTTDKRTGGVNGQVTAGPVTVGAGVTREHAKTTALSRQGDGKLKADVTDTSGQTRSINAGVNLGAAGMTVGASTTHTTSFGFSFTIDPKMDPDGKILAALNKCETPLEYEMFRIKHPVGVTFTGRTVEQSDAKTSQVGVTVLGAQLSMDRGHGIDEKTTVNAAGSETELTGSSRRGGALGWFKDSEADEAKATTDAAGDSSLDINTTTENNHDRRAVRKTGENYLKKVEGSGASRGALATAAGEEQDDSTSRNVAGITLTNKELKRIGSVACASPASWMHAVIHLDDRDDWSEAGEAIAKAGGSADVTAKELARYIGKDASDRETAVKAFIRGGYGVAARLGKKYEFPNELRAMKPDYDEVLSDECIAKCNALPAPEAVKECKRLEEMTNKLELAIRRCEEFSDIEVKLEMLFNLGQRRKYFADSIKRIGGEADPDHDPELILKEKDRLTQRCKEFGRAQAELKKLLDDELDGYEHFTGSMADARKYIHQLEEMHTFWNADYLALQKAWMQLGKSDFKDTNLRPSELLLNGFKIAAHMKV